MYEIITRGGDLHCAWHTGSSCLVPAVAVVREEVSSAKREGPQEPGWGGSPRRLKEKMPDEPM